MLPIEMKEPIQNGTMKALVSKDVKANIAEYLYFIENKKSKEIEILSMSDYFYYKIQEPTNAPFIKAECVGVVKVKLLPYEIKKGRIYNFIIQYANGKAYSPLVCTSSLDLGFYDRIIAWKYYKTLLGEDLTGYLHLFKIEEITKC